MREYTFREKLDRIYDELWGIQETTSLGREELEGIERIINLIDDVLGR